MRSWLWVVDVFSSFVFWTHGAFTTQPRSAAYELGTHLLLYVLLTAVVHGGCVDGLVGGWLGGCVGWYVVDCVLSRLWVVTLFFFVSCFLSAIPASLWHSSAYHY